MDRLAQAIIVLHLIVHGSWASRPSASSAYHATMPNNKSHTITVSTNCNRELFHMTFNLAKPFKGIIFAKDFMDECRSHGNSTKTIELTLPISGCGVRSEHRPDGAYELSVRLVVQMDGKLRQSTDVEKIVRCSVPDNMMDMSIQGVAGDQSKRIGRMQQVAAAAVSAPRVRVWLELGGEDGSGAVEVGQATTLAVRAVLPGNIGVHVVDCSALDGLGESSQKLLDDRGCPIDEQVMPSLFIRSRPTEDGWSKPNHDDIVEKLFTATFPAFKFPDRERLHVSCGVQLCSGDCPKINCKEMPADENRSMKTTSNQLARIEVFNSLSVTAPQIDLDRLRGLNSNGNNVTIDELPPTVRRLHSDGILCMSTSKLALAFCLLGMIFLVAVIVSICCLLRSKLQSSKRSVITTSNKSVIATSIFSSSSSSQFGSKLFIPYGGSLPYGRVY